MQINAYMHVHTCTPVHIHYTKSSFMHVCKYMYNTLYSRSQRQSYRQLASTQRSNSQTSMQYIVLMSTNDRYMYMYIPVSRA